MFQIIQYNDTYEDALMELIQKEGQDWEIYWKEPNASLYRKSFKRSITYLAISDGVVCGYSRSMQDALFIYVCDLLVNEAYRGKKIGRSLLEQIQIDYPEYPVYIMSGNDGFYEKIKCKKEGSVYLLS